MKKPRKSGKKTLSDVAKVAGVSAITVSRALREPSIVSPETLERIEKAVSDLGYVPNFAAQALASRRTNVIGALIPSVTNNVFSDVLRGMYNSIADTRYQLQLGNTRYSQVEEEKLLLTFLSQRPAGLIVSGIDQSKRTRRILEEADCPIVQIMDIEADPVDMIIGFSHRDAARTAVEHLLSRGYRRIAFLGARMDPRTQRRLQGYTDAMGAAGLADEGLIITTPQASSVSLGAELFGHLMGKRPDADAVFCNNDDIAVGALFEAQRRRISIPEEFGICGFNDLEIMAVAQPPLTSVRTYRSKIGEESVAMLVASIEGKPPAERIIDIGFEVVVRASTNREPASPAYRNRR